MHRRIPLLAAVAILTMMLASGCALAELVSSNDAGPAPTPSFTPKPTFTPTTPVTIEPIVAPTFTPTATPDATPTPVDTPTPEVPPTPEPTPTPEGARLVINNPTLNVRSGPGTNYGIIGQARNGERYDVTGKNAAGSWYQINFNGQTGWVAGQYVVIEGDANAIQVAANIPAPPVQPTRPPAPTPVPQPTAPPAPVQPPAPSFPWTYVAGSAAGAPQCAGAFFRGQVQYANGSPQNGVCVLIDYYGPRTIKFSGSGGQGDGNWGFSPCVTAGSASACAGPYKVYVVECPAGVPDAGLSLDGSGGFAPQSNVFEVSVTDACTLGEWSNIIFKGAQ